MCAAFVLVCLLTHCLELSSLEFAQSRARSWNSGRALAKAKIEKNTPKSKCSCPSVKSLAATPDPLPKINTWVYLDISSPIQLTALRTKHGF